MSWYSGSTLRPRQRDSGLRDAFCCCAPQSWPSYKCPVLCYSLKRTNISLDSGVCKSCPVPVLVLTPLFVLFLLLMWSGRVQVGGRGNARPRSHDGRRWQDLNAAAGAHGGGQDHHALFCHLLQSHLHRSAVAHAGSLPGTIHADVVLIFGHFTRHPHAHLVEPLVTAAVTLHPVHLRRNRITFKITSQIPLY